MRNLLLSVEVYEQLQEVELSARLHHSMYSPPETIDQLRRDFVVFFLVYCFLRVNFSNVVELFAVVVVVTTNRRYSMMIIVRISIVVCELQNVHVVMLVSLVKTTIVLIYQSK